jgi:GT2 family glycosyltransferase
VDASRVEFTGRATGYITDTLTVGVFVDGASSGSSVVETDGQVFSGVVFLSSKHLDGAAHLIELRILPQMLALASTYEILPMQITPWDAVQVYAGAPLDGTLAPAARYHLRSFRAWFEKMQTDPSVRIPPVYDELLGGFRKRKTYPLLTFAEAAKPTVSVVIPVHNKFEITYFCLCALQFAFNETTFEVIVVDDGSSDETLKIDEFVKGIKVVRHKTSLGFVNSCNDGAALARGEFVMMLNNDTEVTARWLDELISVFRNFNNVGLAGSKLLYPDGHLQEAGGIVWNSGNPWNVGRNANAADPAFNYLRQTDYVSGAAIMLPTELWKSLGGFSAEFAPAYFEDTDLAMKVRAAGHCVVYVPASTVYHYEGQSAGTSVASGMKRFQEVNRPKFKRKWVKGYGNHGVQGVRPDREKDRNVAFRVLFVDQHVPFVDNDAGSYAAFQEIRLFQSQGAKVTFLPRNLAWMDRHTLALQRIGVECLYAPFVMDFVDYIRQNAKEYDVVYVTRYKVGEQIIPLIRSVAPNTKVILNVADLHFLRELREAASGNPSYSIERAEATREAELAVVRSSDLTFSYSDVELAVLESHISSGAVTAKMPWIVDTKKLSRSFEKTKDILFLGGFGHPPNEQAVKFFVKDVLPLVRDRIPDICFNVVGSGAPESVKELASESVQILGYLPDLDEAFSANRIFVAPLLAGAGLKGKVLEAVSRGVPSVLSPVAVEGSGLTGGIDCLVAKNAQEWADAVVSLYTDKKLWERIGSSALNFAQTKFSFSSGVESFQEALAKIDVYGRKDWALVYQHARPQRYGN